MTTTIEKTLRRIVTETFLVGTENAELRGDESFIETGLIDSTGILQLVQFVEQEFEITIDDEDMVPENLDSIDRLVAFVQRKRAIATTSPNQSAPCSTTSVSSLAAAPAFD